MTKTNNISLTLRDEIERYVIDTYDAKPEHLWENYPEYEIFRHVSQGKRKGKWFLLLATVTRSQLGFDDLTGEVIFIANVKCDPEQIDELIHEPGFARGWHMNKKLWLSIMLDGSVPLGHVKKLIDQSYELTT